MRKLAVALLASGLVLLAVVFAGRDSLLSPGSAEAAPQTTTVFWGTWSVAGFSDLSGFYFNMTKPCSDCYVTGAVPDLQFDSGGGNWVSSNYANGAMLHHFVIFNGARDDTTCGTFFGLGDRFFASGNERTVMDLPDGYGYYVPANSPPDTNWDINLHIHNVGSQTRTYRVAVTFTWQPASDNLHDLTSIWLDENNCSTSIYGVPAGYDDRHWDWISNTEGRIITIGGHVHDFGMSVSAENMTTGEWICASTAGYATGSSFDPATVASPPRPNDSGHPADASVVSPGDSSYVGHIEDMSTCSPDAVIHVGDTIRLHSQYNATSTIDDVMGIMNLMVFDNCSALSNPDQADFDNDQLGDACDPDIDGDTIANGSDPEADGDQILNSTETTCGSDPMNSLNRPERLDGPFAGVSDDGDAQVDEALPGGAGAVDCDGDGYPGSTELNVFPAITLRDQDACGITAWPADFVSGGIPNSTNRVTVTDLTSFLAPERHINTSPNEPGFDIRWDLTPGAGLFAKVLNVADLTSLITVVPPMFNGARAFNGPTCPWP